VSSHHPHHSPDPLRLPPIGFGAMVLSPGMYGPIDDADAMTAVSAAVDAGATLIDTSDAYGDGGHNELLVGRAIRGRRDDVVLATKFGLNIPADADRRRLPVGFSFGHLEVNADPALVRGYAERSLRRLATDRIDLYYPHFPDPQVPLEDTVGAVSDLVREGKVRHLGLSNVAAEQVRAAHAVHPVAVVQTEWSLWKPIDAELLAAANERGIQVVAWSPLGSGFLTGTVASIDDDDFRRFAPRFSAQNLQANRSRFAPVLDIAKELGITPSQLALSWLISQTPPAVPIPGSRSPEHIRENTAAAQIRLHPDTLDEIARRLSGTDVAGRALL
jgi:aryl-alcohol dehydrogenase-like predicted oxidoreductase